jgi:sigma-E factor negative regulatory protein RseC
MMQKVTDVIKHTGVVEAINGNNCYVRILQHSACSGCSAQRLCNSSESKEKIITVLLNGEDVQVGETVNIEGTVVQGLRAVYICYMIPLVLLIVSVYLGVRLSGDMLGVFLSLGVLAIYYIVLYLFRNSIGQHFAFTLHKISNN